MASKFSSNGQRVGFFLEDADDFFARDTPVEESVELPELRKPQDAATPRIRVRGMSGLERQAFESHGINHNSRPGADDYLNTDWWTNTRRFELIARSAVRRDGSPIFTLDQVARLARMQTKPMERVFQAAQRVNGYDTQDLKDSAKNAGTGSAIPSGDLPTSLDAPTETPT